MLKKQSRVNLSFEVAELGGIFTVMLSLKEAGKYFLTEFSRAYRPTYFGINNLQRKAATPTFGQFIFKPGVDTALSYATLEEALLVVSLIETIYNLEGLEREIIKIESVIPVKIV
jgi:hypothetical protein